VQLGVGLAVIGSAVFALGIVLFAYPFATLETIQFTGVKTAQVLVRGAAVLVTGLGVWILILGFQI
jgi:ABC-type nickel/cobalt efflux system permease component RcnA